MQDWFEIQPFIAWHCSHWLVGDVVSGFTKISTSIVVVFVLSFLGFTCLTFFQIQQNISEETSGALGQAREMLRLNFSASEMESVLSKSPHLSVTRFHGRLSSQQLEAQHKAQSWLQRQLNDTPPIIAPIGENSYLIITAHEQAELVQNMNFFWLVAGLFLTTLSLLLFTVRIAIKHRLKPLKQLADALQDMANDNKGVDVANSDIEEVRQVIHRFTHLQQSLENKNKQLIKIDKKLAMLQEEERKYLAQELHDNVGQLLSTIKAHAYILAHADEPSVISKSAHKVQSLSQRISDAIRQLTVHLHPLTLDKVSLAESLQRLVYEQEQASLNTKWKVSINLHKYYGEQERDIHIYRFVQEAINNVIKHSQATKVNVDVYADDEELRVTVADNGVGIGPDANESIGLSSMRSRARCIGASCIIASDAEKGVTVGLRLKLGQNVPELMAVAV